MELIIALVCLASVLWYIWRRRNLSTFKNLGIPGPEPSLLFGNLLELYDKGPIKCHEEWVREYGRVLGFYYGMTPVLLVTDPIILKNIFIKDFAKFINREAFNPLFKYDPHDKEGQSVLNLPGKKWKYVRSVLTPTFTAAKMKQMGGSINSSIETMVNILKEKAEKGTVFDFFDTYQRVTMDVITRTAFGVRTDVQSNMKSKLLKATKLLFSSAYKDPIVFLGLCFPFLRRFCIKLQILVLAIRNKGVRPGRMLRKGLSDVLKHRKENPQGAKKDLLQLMIDTKIYADTKEMDMKELEIGNAEYESNVDNKEDAGTVYKKMEDHDIISSAFTVLLAGYETTSTALAFTTYIIAKYPDVQEKLYKEIRELFAEGQNLDYATVNKLQYLEKVLNESMRIYPPVTLFTNRYAVEEVQYGDLKIPKGMLIQAPVYFLHHDPDLWENPETFDPERFNNKTNTNGITYLPFGVGPRNCLGMRFAQLEAKFVLAHVIYNFKIIPANSQKVDIDLGFRIRTLFPKDGIQVRLELRDQDAKGF